MKRGSRAARHPGATVDELAALADDAAGRQHWAEALEFTTEVLKTAPTSVRFRLNEAFFLERLGRMDEALARYMGATVIATEDGEPDLQVALFLATNGSPPSELEPFILDALRKSPDLVEDIDTDELLASVVQRPSVAAAIRRSRFEATRVPPRNEGSR